MSTTTASWIYWWLDFKNVVGIQFVDIVRYSTMIATIPKTFWTKIRRAIRQSKDEGPMLAGSIANPVFICWASTEEYSGIR